MTTSNRIFDPVFDNGVIRERNHDAIGQFRVVAALCLAKQAIDDWLDRESTVDHPDDCDCGFCTHISCGVGYYLDLVEGILESELIPPSYYGEWQWPTLRDYLNEIAPPTVTEAAQATISVARTGVRNAIERAVHKCLPTA